MTCHNPGLKSRKFDENRRSNSRCGQYFNLFTDRTCDWSRCLLEIRLSTIMLKGLTEPSLIIQEVRMFLIRSQFFGLCTNLTSHFTAHTPSPLVLEDAVVGMSAMRNSITQSMLQREPVH